MPSLVALAGIHTAASGPEGNPAYVIKVTNMVGTVTATLTNAEPDVVTWTLNQPDEAHFHFPKNAYDDDDLDVLATSGGAREVQIYRNSDLLTWGPVVGLDGAGSDGKVDCDIVGVDWYLNRLFLDGIIPNLLTNPDFESGTSGWTSNVTFTTPTDTFVVGTQSAKLVNSVTGSEAAIQQTVTVSGAAIGRLLTLSGWVYIESFVGPSIQTRGLYIEAREAGAFRGNNSAPIDNASPPERGEWVKLQTTLWVPPGEVWSVNVRLYAPNGTTRWDNIKLVAMDSLDTADHSGAVPAATDIGYIIGRLVDHVQVTGIGKADLNIGHNTATTGTKLLKVFQYVDHVQFDQALRELLERLDGADYRIDLTPTTRTLQSYAHKRGTDRSATVTLTCDVADVPNSNWTDYRMKRDGAQCITRQTMLGEDNGPAREQGEAVEDAHTGGTILQDVRQAPHGTDTSSLQALADERIDRFSYVPVTVELDVVGSAGFIPIIKCGDLVTVKVSDGFTQVDDVLRIMRISLNCVNNMQTVTVTKDAL